MASFIGMDPEAIRRVAESLRQSAAHLGVIQETIQRLMNEGISGWEGADAADFTYSWEGGHRSAIQAAAAAMEKMAVDVIEDIAEQEKASGIVPGGPGSVLPPGTVIPGTTTPVDAVTPESLAEMDPEDAAELLEGMSPEQAAALLEGMDPEEAGEVLESMGSPANAALLAAMSPAARAAAMGAMSKDARNTALNQLSQAHKDEVYSEWEQHDQQALAEAIGGSVQKDAVSAHLEAWGELAKWDVHGGGQFDYKVMADGSVVMLARFEGEVGRGVEAELPGDVGDASARVAAGSQQEYELKFASVEDAEEFLDDLQDAVTDVGVSDLAHPIDTITDNLADVVDSVDQVSLRYGVHAEVEGDLTVGPFELAGKAGVEYNVDPVNLEATAKWSAELEGSYGPTEGAGPTAALSGAVAVEAKVEGVTPTELSLTASVTSEVGYEFVGKAPGVEVSEGTSIGNTGEVTLKIDQSSPAFGEIVQAVEHGDMRKAMDLAYANSEITYREQVEVAVKDSDGKIEFDTRFTPKVGEVGYDFGVDKYTTTKAYVKPVGSTEPYQIIGD